MSLLVIDIGGTSVKYGQWIDGELVNKASFQTPNNLEALVLEISHICEAIKQNDRLDGVAFSCPGAVNTEEGIIGGISAVPYIHNFGFVELMEDCLGVPVTVENDANCAILAEIFQGEAYHYDNAVFLVIGTGIGGGFAINQRLIKGRNHASGEFGSMRIFDEPTNWSGMASTVSLVNHYNAEQGSDLSGKELFERFDAGDQIVRPYIETYFKNLAKGIYNLLMNFDPDVVFIGGGISTRQSILEELRPEVQALLDKEGLTHFDFNLMRCKHLNDANLIGAAAHFNQVYPK